MLKAYYQDTNCTIYHGDCREILPHLPKVDLVLTDPPYLMNETSGSMTNAAKQASWQGLLRAADKEANIKQLKFSEWLPALFSSLQFRAKTFFFCNDKQLCNLQNEAIKTGLLLHNILVWKKNNACPNRWFMKNCEFILFMHKGLSSPIKNLGAKSCVEFDRVQNKIHPTEKPVSLCQWIIDSVSENIILDPFMGSGSTLIASQNLKRKAIGIEIEEKYCEIAVKRLRQEVLPLG